MRKVIGIFGSIAVACLLTNCTTTTTTTGYSVATGPYGYGYTTNTIASRYYAGGYEYYNGTYSVAPPSDFYYPDYAFSGPYPYTSLTAYRRYDPYRYDPYSYGPYSYRTWGGYYHTW